MEKKEPELTRCTLINHIKGKQTREEHTTELKLLKYKKRCCKNINNQLISICVHACTCIQRPVWACVPAQTCTRGRPKALTPQSTGCGRCYRDLTEKWCHALRGNTPWALIFLFSVHPFLSLPFYLAALYSSSFHTFLTFNQFHLSAIYKFSPPCGDDKHRNYFSLICPLFHFLLFPSISDSNSITNQHAVTYVPYVIMCVQIV